MTIVAPSFPLPNDHGYIYRPLVKGTKGWDDFALQTALIALGYDISFRLSSGLTHPGDDGWFGDSTDRGVRKAQTDRHLTVDGIAGIVTQTALAMALGIRIGTLLPAGLLRGVFAFEGGNQLGNHTPIYENGTRDFGVVQDNLPDDQRMIGFNVPDRILYYASETVARYHRYEPYVSPQRAWELAAGAWNRPAWTDYLANPVKWPLRNKDGSKRDITLAERTWIEGYIDRVTTYVVW